MSPLSLRRYRAERLMRQEFEALRGRVLERVRARLRTSGMSLDPADLDACYAQAWQGLYTALLEGGEVANTAGWLVVVTERRAIDEHRALIRAQARDRALAEQERRRGGSPDVDRDLAGELDDRVRLRQLFEGLRGRLGGREREAAVLCYLQGLSRAEAAAQMGVSETRMRKLMEGRGAGRQGVAGKVETLVEAIRADGWCEQQGSLMRGLAYGILDPQGERYQLALIHRSECPACRAYVAALRGLAAALPPVPALGHWLHAGGRLAANGAARKAVPGALSRAASAGGGGACASGSGAGGGWLAAGGSLAAKLAVGSLLLAGLGAGAAALSEAGRHRAGPPGARSGAPVGSSPPDAKARPGPHSPARPRWALPVRTASGASREFGLEHGARWEAGAFAAPRTPSRLAPAVAAGSPTTGSAQREFGIE